MSRRAKWLAIGAAALAASAVFNRWSARRAERDHPPIGKFIEVDGTRLHYLERGQGTPIVLLHGSGALIQDFLVSGLVDRLAADHRVIVFDRPGYGYSERPRGQRWTAERQAALLARACEQLGITDPVIVGHSWGTLPALAWALDRPGDIRGLALISGYYYGSPRLDAVPNAIIGAPVVGDLASNTLVPIQTRLTGPLGLKAVFSPGKVPQRVKDDMPFTLMLRPGQIRATGADSGAMPATAARLETRYDDLAVPVTVIWDDEDKIIGQADQSARLAAQLEGATALKLPSASHMAHHTATRQVAEAISELT